MKKELKKDAEVKMRTCPRCLQKKDMRYPASSRRDDVAVCDQCGREEAGIDFGAPMTEVEAGYMLRIKEKLRKKLEKERMFRKLNNGQKTLWINIEFAMHHLKRYGCRPGGWLYELSGVDESEFCAMMFNLEKAGAILRQEDGLFSVCKD